MMAVKSNLVNRCFFPAAEAAMSTSSHLCFQPMAKNGRCDNSYKLKSSPPLDQQNGLASTSRSRSVEMTPWRTALQNWVCEQEKCAANLCRAINVFLANKQIFGCATARPARQHENVAKTWRVPCHAPPLFGPELAPYGNKADQHAHSISKGRQRHLYNL